MSITEPRIRRQYSDFGHYFVETQEHTGRQRYVFYCVDSDHFTYAIVYVGDTMIDNYPIEKSVEEIPDCVLDAIENSKLTLIEGIDAGWKTWEGQPEWSKRYVDTSDAEAVSRD